MMAVMNVTRLSDFGYDALDARLEDPMDQRFRSKRYGGTNIEDVKSRVLPGFAKLRAYPNGETLAALEDRYWSRHAPPRDLAGAKANSKMNFPMEDSS
jgi:hypothetical protein